MIDLALLRTFIGEMSGDEARISKANLVEIERELSAGRVALSQRHIADGLNGAIDGLLAPAEMA
jgi:hypothetical protein